MSTPLIATAASRLAEAGTMPQRYGLSVFLRKAYPNLERQMQTNSENTLVGVCGASVERTRWEDQSPDILELLRQRASTDAFVAFQVLQSTIVHRVRIDGVRALEVSMQPGAVLVIDVAPNAHLVVTEHEGAKENGHAVHGSLVVMRIGEGARVQWFGRSVHAPGFVVTERLALLAGDALLEHHSALLAAHAVRENIHVVLNAPGATANVNTVFVGNRDHQFDLGVTADHRAPHTKSNVAAKGVLAGKAQAVYRGLVRVDREARGSDGYQRCDTFLLSPTAEVDPVPNLEINTNDVRCTHGVTVSSLNADQLFYLQSRGFSPNAARHVLIEGFSGRMLQMYPENMRQELREGVQRILTETP